MRTEPLAEFTLKAVVAGILLGIVFGAANAYLGLRVGMTVSASIPAASRCNAGKRRMGKCESGGAGDTAPILLSSHSSTHGGPGDAVPA